MRAPQHDVCWCGCIEFSIFFFLVKIDDENNNDEKNFRMESIHSIEKLRTLQEAI